MQTAVSLVSYRMIKDILIAALLILYSLHAEARPTGATVLACNTLIPEHGINQVGNEAFPYKVGLSDFALFPSGYGYKGARRYNIRLSGTLLDRNFRGFLIQARTVGDNTSVGTFVTRISNKPVCNGDTAATHVNNRQKEFVILSWTAPPTGTGPIRFWYSFVDANRKGIIRHWGAEMSEVIQEVPECTIEGQEYTTCGSACPPTCEYKPGGCIQQCVAGCQCPYGTVHDESINKCVRKENCTCQLQGQITKDCADDPRCAITCSNRFMPRPCPSTCVINGCECPNGTIIDEESKICVPPSECPEVPSCPIKGQFYTTDCYIANATCNDPNPVAKCNYPRCVCPRGQVIDEATNSCINGTQCPNTCKINEISGSIYYNKWNSRLLLQFSSANGANFECKLNGQDYRPCTSPMVWRKLNLRKKHIITVRSTCTYNDDVISIKHKRFRFRGDK